MKFKKIVIMAVILASALGATMVLAQKAEPPDSPGQRKPDDRGRQMFIFRGGEGSWLGVTLADVTEEKAGELKLPGDYGAIVQDVREGSPAWRAGIEKGDVILQFAGERVRSAAELARLVRETPPGRKVSIEISRGGRMRTLSAEIGNAPEGELLPNLGMPNGEIPHVHIPPFDFNMMFEGGPRLGISADELTPQLANYFGVKEGRGVLVREVEKGTPAEKAGLKAGDVIVKVNDTQVASVSDVRRALRAAEKGAVTLTIVRDRKELTLSAQLEPRQELENPKRIAELRGLGIDREEMMRLKNQAFEQAREAGKSAQLVRLQKVKVRQEVKRAMQEHQKELERLRKDLEVVRVERLQEPI